VPTFNFTGQQISKAPTWLIDLDYKPIEDILLYAKWARGYRQGATQPFGPDGLPPFRQEKVDTYEVGLKSSFRGAVSGTFNVAAFYNNFVDQQISASYSVPLLVGVAPNAGVVNAPKSRIYGLEAELVLVPFEGFRIQGAYAYLNSTIKTLEPLPDLPSFVPGSPRQLAIIGAPLPYTPKHKFSIDASYRLPLDESIGEIVLGTTYSYTGKQFYQGPSSTGAAAFLGAYGTNEVYDIKSYGLWTLNASWNRVAGSPVDASFFMTNVGNKHYYLARNLQPTSGFVSRYLAEPRMWGFRLRYNFGS
jgi:iron complex outermembrane recepter protein